MHDPGRPWCRGQSRACCLCLKPSRQTLSKQDADSRKQVVVVRARSRLSFLPVLPQHNNINNNNNNKINNATQHNTTQHTHVCTHSPGGATSSSSGSIAGSYAGSKPLLSRDSKHKIFHLMVKRASKQIHVGTSIAVLCSLSFVSFFSFFPSLPCFSFFSLHMGTVHIYSHGVSTCAWRCWGTAPTRLSPLTSTARSARAGPLACLVLALNRTAQWDRNVKHTN